MKAIFIVIASLVTFNAHANFSSEILDRAAFSYLIENSKAIALEGDANGDTVGSLLFSILGKNSGKIISIFSCTGDNDQQTFKCTLDMDKKIKSVGNLNIVIELDGEMENDDGGLTILSMKGSVTKGS